MKKYKVRYRRKVSNAFDVCTTSVTETVDLDMEFPTDQKDKNEANAKDKTPEGYEFVSMYAI